MTDDAQVISTDLQGCESSGQRVLYSYWRSSTAYRIRLALAYKQLPYRLVSVNLANGENLLEDFRAVNPQMLVPSLEDAGSTFGQSMAIMEYLEEKYPEPAILPHNIKDRSYVRMLANVIACDIHPLNNVRVLNFLISDLDQSEQKKLQWYRHWISIGLAAFEEILEKNGKYETFCLGDTVTMADFCLVPQVYNAVRFDCSLMPFPRVRKISENCDFLPCFAEAHPDAQPDSASLNQQVSE